MGRQKGEGEGRRAKDEGRRAQDKEEIGAYSTVPYSMVVLTKYAPCSSINMYQ
jgi:hypothetical protein